MTHQIEISDAELKEIAAGWPMDFRDYSSQRTAVSAADQRKSASSFVTFDH